MRRVKLNDERGRVLAGFGGLIALVGAVLIATTALSVAHRGSISAEHIVVVPEDAKSVSYCHKTSSDANPWNLQTTSYEGYRGHFTESGTPESGHEEDYLVRYTDVNDVVHNEHPEVLDDLDCAGVPPTATPTATEVPPTATATLPIATSTQQVESTPTVTTTATSTAIPTTTATPPIATSTQQVQASSTPTRTPTNTPVTQASNTPVPPTNTPVVPPPPTNTPQPLVQQVQSVQATPPPVVRALPSTGNGGYEDNSMTLIIGLAMILAGTSISLAAMKGRVR